MRSLIGVMRLAKREAVLLTLLGRGALRFKYDSKTSAAEGIAKEMRGAIPSHELI